VHDQFLRVRADIVLTGSFAKRMTECGRPCPRAGWRHSWQFQLL